MAVAEACRESVALERAAHGEARHGGRGGLPHRIRGVRLYPTKHATAASALIDPAVKRRIRNAPAPSLPATDGCCPVSGSVRDGLTPSRSFNAPSHVARHGGSAFACRHGLLLLLRRQHAQRSAPTRLI